MNSLKVYTPWRGLSNECIECNESSKHSLDRRLGSQRLWQRFRVVIYPKQTRKTLLSWEDVLWIVIFHVHRICRFVFVVFVVHFGWNLGWCGSGGDGARYLDGGHSLRFWSDFYLIVMHVVCIDALVRASGVSIFISKFENIRCTAVAFDLGRLFSPLFECFRLCFHFFFSKIDFSILLTAFFGVFFHRQGCSPLQRTLCALRRSCGVPLSVFPPPFEHHPTFCLQEPVLASHKLSQVAHFPVKEESALSC